MTTHRRRCSIDSEATTLEGTTDTGPRPGFVSVPAAQTRILPPWVLPDGGGPLTPSPPPLAFTAGTTAALVVPVSTDALGAGLHRSWWARLLGRLKRRSRMIRVQR